MATIMGTSASEALPGTSGDDVISAGSGDTVQAGGGDDEIRIDGTRSIDGGDGRDTLVILPPATSNFVYQFDTLRSVERIDFESQSGGTITAVLLWGRTLSGPIDQLAESGLATIGGGGGQDVLGLAALRGGSFTLPNLTRVNWTTGTGTQILEGDMIILYGGGDSFSYELHVSDDGSGSHAGVDQLRGGGGADTLIGNNGRDILNGGGGPDVLRAGGGDDLLIANGNVISSGDGMLISMPSIYDGGEGFDYLVANGGASFAGSTSFTSIEAVYLKPFISPTLMLSAALQLTSSVAATLPANLLLEGSGLFRVDVVAGSFFSAAAYSIAPGSDIRIQITGSDDGNETITGTSIADVILGGGGHDDLFGGGGSDSLNGETGNDHLYGQSANGGADGADTIAGGDGNDYIQGNAGNDLLDGGNGSDRVNGGANNDVITSGAGNDTVNGNLGNDIISGGEGNDSLRGGQGDDSISGQEGTDVISGDLGWDTLSGGSGDDMFVFSGPASAAAAPDLIVDFDAQQDRLAIGYQPIAILTDNQAGLSDAAVRAQQLFDGRAGNREVAAVQVGSDTYIFFSSNGGATADSAVQLQGVSATSIDAQDFA